LALIDFRLKEIFLKLTKRQRLAEERNRKASAANFKRRNHGFHQIQVSRQIPRAGSLK